MIIIYKSISNIFYIDTTLLSIWFHNKNNTNTLSKLINLLIKYHAEMTKNDNQTYLLLNFRTEVL